MWIYQFAAKQYTYVRHIISYHNYRLHSFQLYTGKCPLRDHTFDLSAKAHWSNMMDRARLLIRSICCQLAVDRSTQRLKSSNSLDACNRWRHRCTGIYTLNSEHHVPYVGLGHLTLYGALGSFSSEGEHSMHDSLKRFLDRLNQVDGTCAVTA